MGSKNTSERKYSDLYLNKDDSNLRSKDRSSGATNLARKDVDLTSGGVPFLTS